MKSIQYTVRNIPSPVDRALRTRAKKQGKNFNQTIVDALKQASGATDKAVEYHDLDWFIGSIDFDKHKFDESMNWLNSLPSDMDSE